MTTNEFLGSLVSGLLSTAIFLIVTRTYRYSSDKERYRYIVSKDDEYDWKCWNMQSEDVGKAEAVPNGAEVNIKPFGITGRVFSVTLKHPSEGGKTIRTWCGKLTMINDDLGTITLKYQDRYQFDIRQVFVGTWDDGTGPHDYIFSKGDGKDTGKELMRRPTSQRVWYKKSRA
ncbi:MAG TPA: hypothetical protein PLU53_09385 [Bacteroidia bacterium]|nr:hypothetical protein [Bacteroidia bacterium]